MNTAAQRVSRFYVPPPRSTTLLDKYLTRSRGRDIIYGGYLFNHEAHYIIVAGCSELEDSAVSLKMHRWEDYYFNKDHMGHQLDARRVISPEMPEITEGNWRSHFGDPKIQQNWLYPVYLKFFDRKVSELGLQGAIECFFREIVPGMAACAVHPIIHLGFGLEAGHSGIVAEGLATMCANFHVVGSGLAHWSSTAPGIIDASVSYLKMAADNEFHDLTLISARNPPFRDYNVGNFQKKMLAFSDPRLIVASSLDDIILGLPAVDSPLEPAVWEATALISAAYLASDCEFFIIHGLTSLHATLVIIAHLESYPDLQRSTLMHWWRTLMAVIVSLNIPEFLCRLSPHLESWKRKEIVICTDGAGVEDDSDINDAVFWRQALDIGLTSEDEHAAKAIYALWRWSRWTDIPLHSITLFREAARNQIRLNPLGGPHNNIWFASDKLADSS